jgi:predicted transcriptional regulator
MYMIVLPYLGAVEASNELRANVLLEARRRPAASDGRPDAFDGLSMRLTYRTVCALRAVARSPGASNREVAAEAGVRDQGQISKLLHRLEGLEVIENRGAGQRKGAANAWHLTRRGAEILRMTSLDSRVFG